jgi:hypothetical protein
LKTQTAATIASIATSLSWQDKMGSRMKDSEVVLLSGNRNLADEVLRVISSTPEWLKTYAVKKNLVKNPKTPVAAAIRLVQHLRENDLRGIVKSKNVTGPVKDAARRHLDKRKT